MPTANEIRQQFIDFFCKKHGHTFVPSSSVVPHDDPTLLFTNAGMNQFKPYFLGTEKPPYPRAANTQKCIRAGGKHNDLDDVGKDTYHHTFFEMLGNWSFGDYFKKEAIAWAWELLTDVWKLDKARLHVTVFEGDKDAGIPRDDEAAGFWRAVGVADAHIHLGNKKDNFWEMGDTGPCGPCTEIHYDNTPDLSGGKLVNKGTPDVIEIWNLVFIQFNRNPDKSLTPLPAKHVDTGMGFERVTKVLQGKTSNYDTDVFTPILDAIGELVGMKYGGKLEDTNDIAFRVIADHLRMLTFAISDGADPSNKGRGAVVRSVLRRAYRFGYQYLSQKEPFLNKLIPSVTAQMNDAFPFSTRQIKRVISVVREEEREFHRTIERGLSLFLGRIAYEGQRAAEVASAAVETGQHPSVGTFQPPPALENAVRTAEAVRAGVEAAVKPLAGALKVVENAIQPAQTAIQAQLNPLQDALKGPLEVIHRVQRAIKQHTEPLQAVTRDLQSAIKNLRETLPQIELSRFDGRDVFLLHTTYGFPPDVTRQMSSEFGLEIDEDEYGRWLRDHEEKSRGKEMASQTAANVSGGLHTTDDSPKYQGLKGEGTIQGWVTTGEFLRPDGLVVGDEVGLTLDRTNFYAEQGGQVGDTGWITTDTGTFEVRNTGRLGGIIAHWGKVADGKISAGQKATLEVHPARLDIMRNHTATHLMNWALREVLGDHVEQKGSLVDADKTRFDFTHDKPMTAAEFAEVERLVNEKILADQPVTAVNQPLAEAKKISGVRAVFGEKYPDPVRVVVIGEFPSPLRGRGRGGEGEEATASAAPSPPAPLPRRGEGRNASVEFCGGTHLSRTSQACLFKIVGQEGVAKGVRRITAVTGPKAVEYDRHLGSVVGELTERFRCRPEELAARIESLQEEVKTLQQQLRKGAANDLAGTMDKLLASAAKVGDVTVIVGEIPGGPDDAIRTQVDRIKQKAGSAVVLIGWIDGDKVGLLAAVSDDIVKKGIKAGDLIKQIAPIVGGGGGGRPNMAQAGGKDPAKLAAALTQARRLVEQQLTK